MNKPQAKKKKKPVASRIIKCSIQTNNVQSEQQSEVNTKGNSLRFSSIPPYGNQHVH